MTQNLEFLSGHTNIIVNSVIILITILNCVVYKFRQHQETEFVKKNYRLHQEAELSVQGLCYRFSLDEMQQATSNFHDELVVGRGGFGKVYKGTLEHGLTVAIKRLQSMSRQGTKEFETEIQMLSKLRHSHLVSLIGYCNEGCEMILVYEFMPGGTLADHLYRRERNGDKSLAPLSWVQRLKICIGAARGLDYLHTGTGTKHRIIHRDVKTTNILLDDYLEAKISDFGLSKTSPANQATTYVSTHVKGTFGYFDPYYFLTHRLTWRSDVYSFGVVLFEVLCGRPAVDTTLGEEQMGLAGWAQHCFKEGVLGQIIDSRIKGDVSSDSLEAFVRVAIQCLQFGLKHRPTMAEIVVGLESALALQEKSTEYYLPEIITSDDEHKDIGSSEIEAKTEKTEEGMVDVSRSRHQEKQSPAIKRFVAFLTNRARPMSVYKDSNNGALSVILQSSNLKRYTLSDLSIATRNFHPDTVIWHSVSGRIYKGWIDRNTAAQLGTEGQNIVIKMIAQDKDRYSNGNEQWLTEINILGKLCHPNLVKLIGYCLKRKHQLLVYHKFMPQRSLKNYLLKRVSYFQPLSWNLRICIALGAAKGLAYLHSPEANVIHGDIHADHILVDSKFNAKLSGFGLAKHGPEHGRTHLSTEIIRGTSGYLAPEYAITGHLSMKSDIFNFGVVLVETLTGKKLFELLQNEDDLDSQFNDADLNSKYTLATGQHGPPYFTSESRIINMMDADIRGQYTADAALRAASLAIKCLSPDPKSRPDANQVVKVLEQLQDLETSKENTSEALQ